MNFLPKLFFDTATNDNGGGVATQEETIAAEQTPQEQAPVEIPKSIISDDDLKTFGFDSPESLKEFLRKQKEDNVSPEERKEKENITKANFLKFAAESKLLNVDEYNQYETIKSKSDKDLVFEKYLADFKSENPEITDEDELKDAAQEDFNFEYKINSENEATKKKAEAKLARDAKELRNPIESKVTEAQNQFKENDNIRQTYPKFEAFVDEQIKKNTPDKTILFNAKNGDTEIPIEIELTDADRKAMAKEFKTPKTFALFTSAKGEDAQKVLDKKMQGWVKLNKFDEINAKSFEIGKGLGVASGSNIGAEHPYAMNKGSIVAPSGEETLEESNARMANNRTKYKARL